MWAADLIGVFTDIGVGLGRWWPLVWVDLCGFGNMTKVANTCFYCDSGGFGGRCYVPAIVPSIDC